MSEETKSTFRCVPKVIQQKLCGVVLDMVPHCCNGSPYLSIYREGGSWELTGYLPEKDGMILGAAADLLRACEFAVSIFERAGLDAVRGEAWNDSDVGILKAAIAKARGEQ